MKQEEKSLQSREKIRHAAIRAFGEKGYDGASLNVLLAECGVSKGLFYHYYPNKDELYLACVQGCFADLTEQLSQVDAAQGPRELLGAYFAARTQFFLADPFRARVFFDALLQPPSHLRQEAARAREGFERLNRALFQRMLGGLTLRAGLSAEDALHYFEIMQQGAQLRYSAAQSQPSWEALAPQYEHQARLAMEILLYGLAGEVRA